MKKMDPQVKLRDPFFSSNFTPGEGAFKDKFSHLIFHIKANQILTPMEHGGSVAMTELTQTVIKQWLT